MVRKLWLVQWFVLLSVAGSSSAGAAQLDATEAFVLRLDSFDYAMVPGVLEFAASGSITLLAPNQLQQCRRANGASQPASSHRLIYDSLGRFVYLADPFIRVDGRVAQLSSTSGDMVCAGGLAVDRLFAGSFE
ncbi:MAG: hypothetical protein IPK97_08260 [Ahniella sp.]|nr:hypothetical protein [Ahniella sp.]